MCLRERDFFVLRAGAVFGLLVLFDAAAAPFFGFDEGAGSRSERAAVEAWERLARVRTARAGSDTCSLRPGATLVPVNLFQRRNWLSETPKRSAMETSVSPLRVV